MVTVVVIEQPSREELEQRLLEVEEISGKRWIKWRSTSFARRLAYLEAILRLRLPQGSLLYAVYHSSIEYTALTIYTLAQAIGAGSEPQRQANIMIDGLNDRELRRVTRGLRQLRVRYRNIRGIRDEASPFIRLADALAGFFRDYKEGKSYARELYERFLARRLLVKLE